MSKKEVEVPKDLQGLSTEEQLKKVLAEIEALDAEYITQVKETQKILAKSKSKKEFLDKTVKMLIKRSSSFFAHRGDPELTYQLFKQYYDAAGMKFTRKDAEEVRENMLLLAQKLYEIHNSQVEKMEKSDE